MADFAAPFPIEIISAILGVPHADRQQIRHWTDQVLFRRPGDPNPTPEGVKRSGPRRTSASSSPTSARIPATT